MVEFEGKHNFDGWKRNHLKGGKICTGLFDWFDRMPSDYTEFLLMLVCLQTFIAIAAMHKRTAQYKLYLTEKLVINRSFSHSFLFLEFTYRAINFLYREICFYQGHKLVTTIHHYSIRPYFLLVLNDFTRNQRSKPPGAIPCCPFQKVKYKNVQQKFGMSVLVA